MRLPASIRYLPARLAPVANPIVWIPVLALGLVGVFAWEYSNHPDWLKLSEPVTNQSADTIGLTPEEQGQVAELDTLDVLLNDPNLNNPDLSTSSTPLNPAAALSQTAPTSKTENLPPFSQYLEQYSLLGAGTAAQSPEQSILPTPSTRNLGLATNSVNSSNPYTAAPSGLANSTSSGGLMGMSQGLGNGATPLPESALARAIQQLNSATSNASPSTSSDQASFSSANGSSPSATTGVTAAEVGSPLLPSGQSTVIPGSLSGNSNVSFIRTTPNMSPPPGTTGYTPPSSLNLSTFNRSLNQSNAFPSSIPTAAPTFDLRQPQNRSNALPNPNAFQTQTPQALPSTFNSAPSPNISNPNNGWDSFWGGY